MSNISFDFSKLVTSHRRMERIQKYYRHIIDGHQKPSKASEKPIEVEDVPVDEPKVRKNSVRLFIFNRYSQVIDIWSTLF